MELKVNLHTHSSESPDACMSPRQLAEYHRDKGFDAIAITDHGTVTEPPDVDGITVIRGVEHNVGAGLRHLLEYPDHDLRIFPHPTFTGIKGDDVALFMQEYDCQGVECYNRGHHTAHLHEAPPGAVPVSSSDFHHPGDERWGFITVDAASPAASDIMNALKGPRARERISLHRKFNAVDLPARAVASLFNVIGIGQSRDESNLSSNPSTDRLGMFKTCPNCGPGASYNTDGKTILR